MEIVEDKGITTVCLGKSSFKFIPDHFTHMYVNQLLRTLSRNDVDLVNTIIMATSVKNKIRLEHFLFLLLLLSGGMGIYNLVRLKNDAKMILEDNYESLDYCHIMQRQLDSFNIDRLDALRNFDDALRKQRIISLSRASIMLLQHCVLTLIG